MATHRSLVVGQFSESPVLAAASALGLDAAHGMQLTPTRVKSSPAQFASLRDGEIDVAVTSPDNVLLYGTTDRNPLETVIDLRMIRAIDRGLGLTLVSNPRISGPQELENSTIGVDVVRSGFALLLFTMLDRLGVDRATVQFAEVGSTPTRLERLLAGELDATILNAESRVRALAEGMRPWSTSADVSEHYLGTVLAVRTDLAPDTAAAITAMWDEATAWLLDSTPDAVATTLGGVHPALGDRDYVDLIRDPDLGLLRDPEVRVSDLAVLTGIRRACGAYAPDDSLLAGLVGA